MKKIFTLAAAVLASFSLWAATETHPAEVPASNSDVVGTSYTLAGTFNAGAGSAKVGDMPDKGVKVRLNRTAGEIANAIEFTVNEGHTINAIQIVGVTNSGGKEATVGAIYVDGAAWNGTFDGTLPAKDAEAASNILVDGIAATSSVVFEFAELNGASQANICWTVTYDGEGGEVIPSTDPVASVTLSGDAEAYVGETVTITATTDVKANAFQWLVNDAVQEGAEAAKFDFKADAAGTYSIVCKAKNDNNADWVASAALDIVVTEKTLVEQVEIDGPTVWDWTKAASVKEIKWTGEQKDAEPVLLANVEGMNNNQDFNSQALLFSGEYPVRDSKLCQGHTLIFKTKVAGYVQVAFSNTGTKDDPRYVAVNDVVNTEVGSLNSKEVESAFIPVEAGEVRINGAFADGTRQYLRIYKVTFGVGEIPTAIDNTEAAVKAVKVIRNGQLLIEKNGVLFNAQGAVVK